MSDISISVTTGPSISIDAGVDETTLITATASLIDHANSHISGGGDPINHNNLVGLQGGNSSERYHLTKAQYDSLGGDGSFDFVSLTGNETISGIKTFAQRPQVNGTGVMLSGEAAQLPETIVYQTGNQAISGIKTFTAETTYFATGDIFIGYESYNGRFGLFEGDGDAIIAKVSGINDSYIIGSHPSSSSSIDITSGKVSFAERPFVNGTGVLLSGETTALTNVVFTTGSQTISGVKSFVSTIRNVANNNQPGTLNGFIGGGDNNVSTALNSFIGGGSTNRAGSLGATVAGGYSNTSSGDYAVIGGGLSNRSIGSYSNIVGGFSNTNSGFASAVGGGGSNLISSTASYSNINGGRSNTIDEDYSNIGGGRDNKIFNQYAHIGGGSANHVSGDYSAIVGGYDNKISGSYAFAGGGRGVRIPSAHIGASVLADGQDRTHSSSGAYSLTLDFASGIYVPTGSINTNQRIFVNGTGVLLSGEASAGDTGYLTGYVAKTETGDFYPRSNPSGFITGVDLSSYATQAYVTGISGGLQTQINSVDNNAVKTTGAQTIGGTKTFSDSVYINNLYVTGLETIVNTTNTNVASNYLLLNLTGGAVDGGIFFVTGSGLTGINDSGPIIGFDHSDKFKFGVSTRASDLSTLDTIASREEMTGISGYLQGQITTLNNATGSYVLDTETGNFITTSQTGQFYASSNPSGFITGVDLSSYATQNYVTGASGHLQTQITTLTNATGSYVLDTETGNFITSSQTGAFLTTGAADLRYVDLTSSQTIAGAKTFSNNSTFNGTNNTMPNQASSSDASVLTRKLYDDRDLMRVRTLFPASAINASLNNGATARRTTPRDGIMDGDLASTGLSGAYIAATLFNTMNDPFVSSSAVDSRQPWTIYARTLHTVPSNTEVLWGIGASLATLSAGVPTGNRNFGMQMLSNTGVRLWVCNNAAPVFSSAASITNILSGSNTPTHEHYWWLENNPVGTLSLYWTPRSLTGSYPDRPTSALCTLTGMPNTTSAAGCHFMFRASAASPGLSFSSLWFKDAKFIEI